MSLSPMYEPESGKRLFALLEQGDISEVLAYASQLSNQSLLDSTNAEQLLRAARNWYAQGLLKEQQYACELVLSAVPQHFEALHLLGYNAQVRGEMAQAEEYFTRALAGKPDYAFSQLALTQLRMMRTHFREGRDRYEARFDAVTEGSGPDWRGLPITRWRGENLTGKKLYLWAEQGLGDIVMFAGFLHYLLAQSPARIALGMFPKLISLFARSFPAIDVEPVDDAMYHALAPSVKDAFPHIEKLMRHAAVPFSLGPLKEAHAYVQRHGLFDLAAPLGDMLVHAMPEYFPARHPPYLIADPKRVMEIRNRLGASGKGRRIGISWSTTNARELTRNIALEEWLPVLATAGCHFISLQHQVGASEIEQFCARHDCRITVDTATDLLMDAEGLAALIAAQDAVITIDNSNVHLAGALGVPTALLLPKGHNFRWPEQEGGGTLWYNSVTTLRQKNAFEWDDVIRQAVAWLKALA